MMHLRLRDRHRCGLFVYMQPLGSLHLLASENDVPVLTFLLDNGADSNQRDEEGCTALHWAADRGSMQVVILHCRSSMQMKAATWLQSTLTHSRMAQRLCFPFCSLGQVMTSKHLPAPMPAGLLALWEHLGFNVLNLGDHHALGAIAQGKLS